MLLNDEIRWVLALVWEELREVGKEQNHRAENGRFMEKHLANAQEVAVPRCSDAGVGNEGA